MPLLNCHASKWAPLKVTFVFVKFANPYPSLSIKCISVIYPKTLTVICNSTISLVPVYKNRKDSSPLEGFLKIRVAKASIFSLAYLT